MPPTVRSIVSLGLAASVVTTLLLLYASEGVHMSAPQRLAQLGMARRNLAAAAKARLRTAVNASRAGTIARGLQRADASLRSLGAECTDNRNECADWARTGECESNPAFMVNECRRSCGFCPLRATKGGRSLCKDASSYCGEWAAVGECDSNPGYMKLNCPVTCHLCQSEACHDVDEQRCEAQARRGDCRAQPERMFRECRWACRWCAMETSSRCRREDGLKPAATKGAVEFMFGRAASSLFAKYSPRVLRRDPWVIVFDDFLSATESDAIIRLAEGRWSRSVAGDGIQPVRTSSTAWCDSSGCLNHPLIAPLHERISNLTLVPPQNAEFMQVLRYETGQFYKTHHDQNSPATSYWGPRMYTFFMYLSDGVEGGHTRFPRLNISVAPKRGRAVLWPSVLDSDPLERDDRTEHESVTVDGGVKFGANYWLHMYDFRAANKRGCGNSQVSGNW